MQRQKYPKNAEITIPAVHTYLIKQFQIICNQFKISLLKGTAQIYGLELKINYPQIYLLPCSIPIFTWEGCTIRIDWKEQENIKNSSEQWCDLTQNNASTQSPMIQYLQIHYQLTTFRKLALEQVKQGPNIAIIGGQNTGMQNVTTLLLNYAGKINMKPIFIDLQLQNSIFIDGSIGAIAYQYMSQDNIFQKTDKITYFYGNRKIRKQSYLRQAKLLYQLTKKKLEKQCLSYKEKGSNDQYPSFCSGIVLQCPKIKSKEDKKYQRQIIAQLLKIYQITHTIIIDSPQTSAYLTKTVPTIQKLYNTVKLEGTESFLQKPKPLKSKIQRYFDSQYELNKPLVLKINQIILYQLIEPQNQRPFCRIINISQESIVKSTIAILYAKNDNIFDKYSLAQKVQSSPICCLGFIFRIDNGEITLHIANQNFWEECKDKIWISTIAENNC